MIVWCDRITYIRLEKHHGHISVAYRCMVAVLYFRSVSERHDECTHESRESKALAMKYRAIRS